MPQRLVELADYQQIALDEGAPLATLDDTAASAR